MKINISDETSGDIVVEIKWGHHWFKTPSQVVGIKRLVSGMSFCQLNVEYAGGVKQVFEGKAVCKAPDMWVKEIGRRKALSRALAKTTIWKEGRTTIWEEYLKDRQK